MPKGYVTLMPKGYVILTEAIKDQAGMDAYGRAAAPAMISSGASVLAVDPQPIVDGRRPSLSQAPQPRWLRLSARRQPVIAPVPGGLPCWQPIR